MVVSPESTCAECLRRFTSGGRDGRHLCDVCWSELKAAENLKAGGRSRRTKAFGIEGSGRARALAHAGVVATDTGVSPECDLKPAHSPGTHPKSGAQVLIVEDQKAMRDSMAAILRDEGYVVLSAADGLEALDKLRRHEINVMLLDLRLPRLDGRTMLEGLVKPPPVVVCSAFEDADEAEIRNRFGSVVVEFLRKPVPPKRLIEATAVAAGQRRIS